MTVSPATGTVVTSWQDAVNAWAAVRVAEAKGTVEYVVSTPLLVGGVAQTPAQLQAALAAAVTTQRSALYGPTTSALALAATLSV